MDAITKLAEGLYVAVTVYAPGASGCCGVKVYVTTPGPVLLTCTAKTILSAQGAQKGHRQCILL